MSPSTLARLVAQSARRGAEERAGAAFLPLAKNPPATPCTFRGEVIHPSRAPGTTRTYHACLNPERPLGEAVCACKGCGPSCPGYSATREGGEVEDPSDYPKAPAAAVEPPVPPPEESGVRWAYGVTTVPRRRDDPLPRTLSSLAAAGFDKPRLFVDGEDDPRSWAREFGLEVSARYPFVRTHANWVLSLTELYLRDPLADRFAVFQDDLVACRGLRAYLDACKIPERGYWNLYTVPHNQRLAPRTRDGGTVDGWFMSNQLGKGALGLVFDRLAVVTLLTSQHMVMRPQDQTVQPNGWYRGQEAVDGGVVAALKKAGWAEWCHSPSLLQHTGEESVMGHIRYKPAESFRGEAWDVTEILGRS